MPELNFSAGCTENDKGEVSMYIDRSGTLEMGINIRREGFYISLDGIGMHFEDERDALRIALRICDRLGVNYEKAEWIQQWEEESPPRLY
jgi:hypothetical protein